MKNKYNDIPIFENERRRDSHEENLHHCGCRQGVERRTKKGISQGDLSKLISVIRDEQTTLIDFISDKENKKFQIFKFQLAAIAILGISTVSALPLLEKFISTQSVSDMLSGSADISSVVFMIFSVFNIVGIVAVIATNFISATVIRHILSIKSNITLAVRQLNCNRESIQRAISAQLCGKYPVGEYRNIDERSEWNDAEELYLRHNKFPTDNKELRAVFFRRQRNFIIKIVYFLFGWLLSQKQKKCVDIECENIKDGRKCFTLDVDGEEVHYSINRHDDIQLDYDTGIPKGFIQRIMLLGYRASYVQSADMMAVLATCIITVLVSLLLPLGNIYMSFRLSSIEGVGDEAIKFAIIFGGLELFIVLFFATHFAGILYRSMNKIVNILTKESKSICG